MSSLFGVGESRSELELLVKNHSSDLYSTIKSSLSQCHWEPGIYTHNTQFLLHYIFTISWFSFVYVHEMELNSIYSLRVPCPCRASIPIQTHEMFAGTWHAIPGRQAHCDLCESYPDQAIFLFVRMEITWEFLGPGKLMQWRKERAPHGGLISSTKLMR